MSSEPRKLSLIAEADKCVMCGMCLPQCPTYQLAQDENESPRGRLMLGKALLSGELGIDAQSRQHINNCLLCRQCERICPSEVKFGYFMDGLRETLRPRHEPIGNTLEAILENPAQGQHLNRLLRTAQLSGAKKLVGLLPGKWGRLARSLPVISKVSTQQEHYPVTASRHQVSLFKGCTQTVFGSALFDSSIKLLNQLAVTVQVPAGQGCCGALSQHHGHAPQSESLAANNLAAFASQQTLPVITLASGCAASLKDYARLADKYSAAQEFSEQVTDISHYLSGIDWPENIAIQPLQKRVVVHSPCSLRNVLRQEAAVIKLLARIPEAEILPLKNAGSCCGAAGSYMFEDEHQLLSDTLADETVEQIHRLGAELVVTSNIGCAMQLQASLQRAGLAVRVMHPVELLAQQLGLD